MKNVKSEVAVMSVLRQQFWCRGRPGDPETIVNAHAQKDNYGNNCWLVIDKDASR